VGAAGDELQTEKPEHRAEAKAVAYRELPVTRDVWDMVLLADGKSIVTGHRFTRDQPTIVVWDLATGRQVAALDEPKVSAKHLAISPDGSMLASRDKDCVRIWNTRTWREMTRTEVQDEGIARIAFSRDSKRMAVTDGDNHLMVWNVTTNPPRLVRRIELERASRYALAFVAKGNQIAIARDRRVEIVDVATGRVLRDLIGNGDDIESSKGGITILDNEKTALTVSNDKTIRLWDIETELAFAQMESRFSPCGAAISADEKLLAVANSRGFVDLYHVPTRRLVTTLDEDPEMPHVMALTADGKVLVTAYFFSSDIRPKHPRTTNNRIRVWDLSTIVK
jgi:WD40 repeat protein